MGFLRAWTSPLTPARRNGTRIWLCVPVVPLPAASEGCRSGLHHYRCCHLGRIRRRCPRRSANGAGSRQGRTANRAAIRTARSIAVVNPDKHRLSLGELFNQPLSNAPAGPIYARTWRRLNFLRRGQSVGLVNAQTLEARSRRLCTRIVDADVPFE
jgi:hypothetical protein